MSSNGNRKPERCPGCYSRNVVSNTLDTSDHTAAHLVVHNMSHHHPVIAGVVAAGWLAMKAVNHFTEKWKCQACGKEFS